jgi:hypothetical protein
MWAVRLSQPEYFVASADHGGIGGVLMDWLLRRLADQPQPPPARTLVPSVCSVHTLPKVRAIATTCRELGASRLAVGW